MFTEITRPQTSAMLSRFEQIIRDEYPFLRSGQLYLAISGGKDSMALSHLLLKAGIEHTLLHCNFQLRGKESDEDENFLRAYAAKNNLTIHIKRFDTQQIADEKKQTIQECARALRYDWFKSFLANDPAGFLLTAHHLDDSIETFFINLFRGTGYRGLAGIPPIADRIVRPLSDFTAEEIFRYLDEQNLDYRSDSSNAKRDYLRNKIRLDLMPEMLELEPAFRPKMASLFHELNDLKAWVSELVLQFKKNHTHEVQGQFLVPVNELNKLHPFLKEQVFHSFGVHRKNAGEFNRFLQSNQAARFYTDQFEFILDREHLLVRSAVDFRSALSVVLNQLPFNLSHAAKNYEFHSKTDFTLIKNQTGLQQIDLDKFVAPFTLRNWSQGDRMIPLGMSGSKLISDILTDKKISLLEKENQLVLQDANGEIMILAGLVISEKGRITVETKRILELRIN